MKGFDYIIIGGGCAGLSLAYELQIHKKLENKTLGIIEPRTEYKKDRSGSESLNKNNLIYALWCNVSNTQLSTTISNSFGVSVSTVEHLMSALSGLHIDNLNIYIDASEVPIMDGSAKNFYALNTKNLNTYG